MATVSHSKECQLTEAERQRAEALEAENQRLRALLADKGLRPPG